jgi:hemerythrin-like domain-containing protein
MLRDPALIPLSHQHQHALALCLLTERALAAAPTADILRDQARTIVNHFDGEMRRHFDAEEEALFPALQSFSETRDLTVELIAEHRRMAVLVDAMRHEVVPPLMLDFSALLRQHVHKEERVLFEQAQRLLSREQLDFIAEQLAGGL